MAVNVYTGVMGSGKSFEVVKHVIVPAISKGRRVVTNIDGINSDKIRAYCVDNLGVSIDKCGSILIVSIDEISSNNFFPNDYDVTSENYSIVCPGDLVVVDEAWRVWGTDCKISNNHKIFFREHRHFVDSITGFSCDLVAIVQDISDLHRMLKVVVEFSFRTHKLKALGLNKSYSVNMWNGWRQAEKSILSTTTRFYDSSVFPLYSSYAGGAGGDESSIDNRQSIFHGGKIFFKIGIFIVLSVFCIYYLFNFFNKRIHPDNSPSSSPSVQSAVLPSQPVKAVADSQTSRSPYRIIGSITIDGFDFIVLSDGNSLRYENPSNFKGFGSSITGTVDGLFVSRFTGKKLEIEKK